MTEEKRTPAFWRVVLIDGCGRLYWTGNGWTTHASSAKSFDAFELDAFIKSTCGKAVPVYHRVVRKQKAHGIGWAVKQLKAGKKVRRPKWGMGVIVPGHVLYHEDLLATDWELAE